MSNTARSHSLLIERTTARLALALAASALVHWGLLGTPLPESLWPGLARDAAIAPITVRLALEPTAAAHVPAAVAPETHPLPQQETSRRGDSGRQRSESPAIGAARPGVDEAPAMSRAPDPTYYAARDLDVYPRPVVPLDLDWLISGIPEPAAGRFRLLLLIDEHGAVNDIAAPEGEPAARIDEGLHAKLAAVRFVPAERNGRAVKSRIVLSVRPAQERREP